MEKFTDMMMNVAQWLATAGVKIVLALLVFFIFCKVVNFLFRKMDKKFNPKKLDITGKRLIINWGRRIVKFLGFVCVLTYLGVETSGIAAAIASIGLTIGLALQGSLSNFAGGVVIIVLHPYRVGDFIECSGVSGTVEEIELFHTYLVTPDNKRVIIPNGQTANATITNYSAKDTRRDDMTFSIAYGADFEKAKEIILTELRSCESVLDDPEPFVNISAHSNSSIDILARFWSPSDKFWDSHWHMLEAVKKAFDDNGIEIPFPQLDVHLKGETDGAVEQSK